MINQQLLDYIKQQLQQGVTQEQIKSALMANGWQAQDIDEGFNAINAPVSQKQSSNSSIKKPTKILKTVLVSIAGILFAVAAGGIVLFNPDAALRQSLVTFATSRSSQSEIQGAILSYPNQRAEGKIVMGLDAIDDPQNPRVFLEFEGTDEAGQPFKFSMRLIDEVSYFRLEAAPALFLGEARETREFMEQKVLNQWIKIDLREFERQIEAEMIPFAPQIQNIPELEAEMIWKLSETLAKAQIFKRQGIPRPAFIDGSLAWRMGAELDPDGVINLIKELAVVLGEEAPSESEIAQTRSAIDVFNRDYSLQIWIDWRNYPRKLQFERRAQAELREGQRQLEFLLVRLHSFEEPVAVEVPVGARSVEELLQELFLHMLFGPGALPPGMDFQQLLQMPPGAEPQIDLEELQRQLELLPQPVPPPR
jgi:hypothetical protein